MIVLVFPLIKTKGMFYDRITSKGMRYKAITSLDTYNKNYLAQNMFYDQSSFYVSRYLRHMYFYPTSLILEPFS